MRKLKSLFILISFCGAILFILDSCTEQGMETPVAGTSTFLYKNHSDTARYIGAQECKKCHQSIYNQYTETEMGHSLKKASLRNSSADFHQQKPVYDEFKNLYYQPFSNGEELYLKEFRLSKNKKDTLYQRIEKINYIIGSGQHTNSHLMEVNGYVHQMPLTFYTQKGEWHLPPGFENGGNTSYDRSIEVECMTCHNGFADYVEGSKNKYSFVPEGIDCERCHGPGSIHKKEKQEGKLVDISTDIDYSIVNPRKLSPDLQMDVCQRCHLQGISVLKEGKSFYDFKPGMKLNELFDVYQSRFTDSLSSFLMASHPDRLRMSKCFIESNKDENPDGLTCITCHNPHKSVREVDHSYFNSKCASCHTEQKCTEEESFRLKEKDNCVLCHMNKSEAYDIPHVNITDHKISKTPVIRNITKDDVSKSEFEKQKDFIRLVCRTSDNPNNKLNAKAYLNYYEKYAYNPELLKTAEEYLNKHNNQNEVLNSYIRLYFLQSRYTEVEKIIIAKEAIHFKDKWTLYRIGQSLMNIKKYNKSLPYLKKAVQLAPFHIDFSQKLASNYTQLGMSSEAHQLLIKLVELHPKNASIQNDLGFAIVMNAQRGQGNFSNSEKHFINALNLNPDLISALENITSLYLNTGNKIKAKHYLQRLLETNPNTDKYTLLQEAIASL